MKKTHLRGLIAGILCLVFIAPRIKYTVDAYIYYSIFPYTYLSTIIPFLILAIGLLINCHRFAGIGTFLECVCALLSIIDNYDTNSFVLIFFIDILPLLAYGLISILFFFRKPNSLLQVLPPLFLFICSLRGIIFSITYSGVGIYSYLFDFLRCIIIGLAAFSIPKTPMASNTKKPSKKQNLDTAFTLEELTKLKELYDKGILTESEFHEKKTAILSKYHAKDM